MVRGWFVGGGLVDGSWVVSWWVVVSGSWVVGWWVVRRQEGGVPS